MKKLNKEKGKNIIRISILFLAALCLCSSMTAYAAKNKFVKRSGNTYYYNSKGKKVKGLKEIKGKYYYFDKKGRMFKKGWKTIKGRTYYFSKKSGAAYIGRKKIGKKYYLFGSTGKRYKTGVYKYKGKYYYTKNGVLQKGLKRVKGKTYYFTSNHYAKVGMFTLKKNKYYFGSNGAAKTGWLSYNGSKYYFGGNGVAYTGTKIIKGQEYKFGADGKLIKKVSAGAGTETEKKPEKQTEKETESGSQAKGTRDDAWDLDAAIDSFNKRVSLLTVNKLTDKSKETLKKLQAELASNQSKYADMQKNYSKYTKAQFTAAINRLKAMTNTALDYKIELIFYPKQSKAVLVEINKYRQSKGLNPLIWSDNLSDVVRKQTGYYCLTYNDVKKTLTQEEADGYLETHAAAQNGAVDFANYISVSTTVNLWIKSGWHEPLLSTYGTHGAVAYYSCNDEGGRIWSKVIYTVGSETFTGATTVPDDFDTSVLFNCTTSGKVFP